MPVITEEDILRAIEKIERETAALEEVTNIAESSFRYTPDSNCVPGTQSIRTGLRVAVSWRKLPTFRDLRNDEAAAGGGLCRSRLSRDSPELNHHSRGTPWWVRRTLTRRGGRLIGSISTARSNSTCRNRRPGSAILTATGSDLRTVRSLAQSSPYEIQIARAGVTLTAAGRYEIIAGNTEHPSQVTVFDGNAHISAEGVDLEVSSGQTVVLSGHETVRADIKRAGPADAFVAWGRRRNNRAMRETG
jgi:hypothetical protein